MLKFLSNNTSKETEEFLGRITFHKHFPSATDLPANITYSVYLKASQRIRTRELGPLAHRQPLPADQYPRIVREDQDLGQKAW